MGWPAAILLLLMLSTSVAVRAADDERAADDPRLQQAMEVLLRTTTGRLLVHQAQQRWKFSSPERVIDIFRWGPVSRTDAVLTRHFNPKTGEEQRDRNVVISLRRGQRIHDLVMDMAHEMTHATANPSWDPYDPTLTPDKYIWAALESHGGEVDAMVSECRVGLELALRFGVSAERCLRYRSQDGHDVLREKIRKDFYRVGEWHNDVLRRLGVAAKKFPLLTSGAPQLYSSTGQAPYPIALIREFDELTQLACQNSRRRMESFSSRSPASMMPYQKETIQFVERRCH